MSRYRWIIPRKCLEDMEVFPATEGKTYEANEKLLFDAVSNGEIRVLLNDEEVSRAHIGGYLSLYSRANPSQDPNTLPPNFELNYDDFCAMFDRQNIDTRKRGRPRKEHSRMSEDLKLVNEMHLMLAGSPAVQQAYSAAQAARILVNAGRVQGAGTPESRAKRLERLFRKHFTS